MSVGGEIVLGAICLAIFWWLYDQVTKKFGTMETIIAVTIVGSVVYASSLYLF